MALHKKQCECGFVVSAQGIKSVADALREHCEYGRCKPENAKNV